MSIRQFYQQAASVNLNGSIVSAGILCIILTAGLLFSWNFPLFPVAIPYVLVSLLHYNNYLLNRNKWAMASDSFHRFGDKNFLEINQMLIAFAPAPAIRMIFFSPDGMLAGELRELKTSFWRWVLPYFIDKRVKKSFGIYDSHGHLRATLIQEQHGVRMLNEQNEIAGFYYSKRAESGVGIAVLSGGRKMRVTEWMGDIRLENEDSATASRLRRGWMPLEWTSHFKDAQTSVLSFEYTTCEAERIAMFTALTHRFMYRDH
ncbi:hypothetical protein [Mesobacillus subterraneus]|uniref:Uncharacterized protein n=1 Tax=Mesobacillus subterraneus TaxID=285983 RepID=A0A3R9KU37_9BACI|nr:hypothetical protein [Mesobacillus subterraneus]RSD26223.1 hypothetical protein EJA10_15520 [Mesobacillus subterraneus]